MIAHTSIGVRDPKTVASVLAEIWKGRAAPFPVVKGAWIVLGGDANGTALEIVPIETRHAPGKGSAGQATASMEPAPWEVQIGPGPEPPEHVAAHVAIASPLDEAAILTLARQQGWRALRCSRALLFDLIEVWLENRYLVEVMTPEMFRQYRTLFSPENCERIFPPAA
jgi:hypothetical protein